MARVATTHRRAGFTADVKVWEVCFDKVGAFREVRRAFDLKGHNASVLSFAFSNDSSRMLSVSKDGTWKFWDTAGKRSAPTLSSEQTSCSLQRAAATVVAIAT